MKGSRTFANLEDLAVTLRQELVGKKCILLYAYNSTGKTRLSMAFKEAGKQGGERDTLYFNAFTEDLFAWDNDLEGDSIRVLKINQDSHFFDGFKELEMETRIRSFLHRYVNFDFTIDYDNWAISFSREVPDGDTTKTVENIKVSRGEENIFIWCSFLAVAQLAIDGAEAYKWVKYIYIDDPISSLDENNAIAVASNLKQLLKQENNQLKSVISSHHTLFFNVLYNEFHKANKYFLNRDKTQSAGYSLTPTGDTPFFHHVATLAELHQAANNGQLYTYHFSMLRSILEKTASFHGFANFSAFIKLDEDDPDAIIHSRMIQLLSHGNYSLYEPQMMMDENKEHFRKILDNFLRYYPFNPELFTEDSEEAETL